MNTSTTQQLSIVEVPPAAGRRASTETSLRKSSVKRNRRTAESKSVKKQASRKPKPSTVRSRASKGIGPSEKPARRQLRQETKLTIAVDPVPPLEMDLPFCVPEELESPAMMADEIPAAPEPSIEASVVDGDGLEAEFVVGSAVDPLAELSLPEPAGTETERIAAPELPFAAETLVPVQTPVSSVQISEPASIQRTFVFRWNAFLHLLGTGWNWLRQRLKTQQSKKRLRVCESVSLGEKRFIAVVQVDGEQFLVGGSSSSVSTLAHLEQAREFADVFRRYGQSGIQA